MNTVFKNIPARLAGRLGRFSQGCEQLCADFLQPPARQRVGVAFAHGEGLQFAARRQHLGAHLKLRRARIDNFAQPIEQRFLLGCRARVLAPAQDLSAAGFDEASSASSKLRGEFLVHRLHAHRAPPGWSGLACAIEKMAASDRIQARGRSRSRASLLAPHGNGFGAGARLRRELADAAQALPGLCRIRFVEPPVLEIKAVLEHPVLASERAQAAA